VKGQLEETHMQLLSQPWVSGIITGQHNGETTWQVSVTDPQVAEAQLFKMLSNDGVVVTEFRRKSYELEEIFMQVIEGGQNVR
jgi:ABC-type uncharacterized transport system ATPase subunit